MRRRQHVTTMLVAGLLLYAGAAFGACTWSWDCSGGVGSCRQIPLCENSFDVPPPRDPSIVPVPAPSVRPSLVPTVPPPGTRFCAPRYLCNGFSCSWRTACQ